jgi:hypothetical protein
MAMYEIGLMDQVMLIALWVGLLYGLYGLVLGWLALTDLGWRAEIAARLAPLRLGGLARDFCFLTQRRKGAKGAEHDGGSEP